jgi:hypothetical protein
MTICKDKVKRLRDTIKYPWFVGFTFYCILYLNRLKRELSLWRLELSQNRIPLIDLLVVFSSLQLYSTHSEDAFKKRPAGIRGSFLFKDMR